MVSVSGGQIEKVQIRYYKAAGSIFSAVVVCIVSGTMSGICLENQ